MRCEKDARSVVRIGKDLSLGFYREAKKADYEQQIIVKPLAERTTFWS